MGFDKAGSIRFQLFREQWRLSYNDFSLLSELYDSNFISTPQYEQFLIDFPVGVTTKGVWQHLSWGHSYEPGLTKASFPTLSSHRYIHAIMAFSFAGRD